MKSFVYVAIAALFVLHHDFFFWDDARLVFGFMPIGLAYHAGFSLAAAGVWALAVTFAWPDHMEKFAEAPEAKQE